MGAQSTRQTIIWSLAATTVWSVIIHVTSNGTLFVTLATFPLLFAIMFLTMRATNRVTGALTRRWLKRPDAQSGPTADAAPEPAEATSMRPEHAQRRRTRRRRRRGRR